MGRGLFGLSARRLLARFGGSRTGGLVTGDLGVTELVTRKSGAKRLGAMRLGTKYLDGDGFRYQLMFGTLFLVAGLVICGNAYGGDTGPLEVKFMEENSQIAASLSGKAGDAAAGREAFANRKQGNCLACHVNSDMSEHSFHGEIGPSLDEVATRYSAAQLRAILVDSKKALNDATMMPGFYSLALGVRIADKFKDKTILSAQQVEDIVAYLQTLK